jgi:hypothetical protein
VGAASGIVAAFGLLLGAPASATVLHVRGCGGGFLDLPIRQDGKPGHDKSCPVGCHAPLCQDRKRRAACA